MCALGCGKLEFYNFTHAVNGVVLRNQLHGAL